VGTNPRDTESETSKGRGMDVKSCMEMFKETDFNIFQGPSVIYREKKDI
jgi:biotin synthase